MASSMTEQMPTAVKLLTHHTIIDLPMSVLSYLGGIMASLATLTWASFMAVFGQFTDPTVANSWPFYGVLIVAIIVLFVCGLAGLRWFVNHWQTKQDQMCSMIAEAFKEQAKSNQAVVSAVNENSKVTSKQNDWFEQYAQDALKGHLTFPNKHK